MLEPYNERALAEKLGYADLHVRYAGKAYTVKGSYLTFSLARP